MSTHTPEYVDGLALRCTCGDWSTLINSPIVRDAEWAYAHHVEKARLTAERDEARREEERYRIERSLAAQDAGRLIREKRDLEAERDALRAQLDRAEKVVEAAVALVADWKANRSTHGGPLIAAVDAYRTPPADPAATDLMAALRASLERAKAARTPPADPPAPQVETRVPDLPCLKCGHGDVKLTHTKPWPESGDWSDCSMRHIEHFHRRCTRCSYEWSTDDVLDAEAGTPEEGGGDEH